MASVQEHLEELRTLFDTVADNQKKIWMEAYMRNQYSFFGVPAPVRKKIQKYWFDQIFKIESELSVPELIRALFQLDQREFHYVAVDLLDKCAHAMSDTQMQITLQECITTKSWWDTVDVLATSVTAKWLYGNKYKQISIAGRWAESDHIWLRRTAILHQIRYRSDTDFELLTHLILQSAHIKNFFIQKAIGWALREYSKTNPSWVTTFVQIHEDRLSPLARREASKWLMRQS
ncbi:MAG: DNA alkylation repair protein [Thermaurantimonas sp.]